MSHENRPRTIRESVQVAPFPVYGLTEHPLDLSISSYGTGNSHLSSVISVCFTFTSPRYSDALLYNRSTAESKNFEITSVDAATQRPEREQMVFELEEPSEGQIFSDYAGWLFQDHHFSEEEQTQAGSPFIWEGTLTLTETIFAGKMLHWRRPLRVSLFLLQSEETVLIGNAYGPFDEELMQLLASLQVLNQQNDLLGRYQQEFDNPNL